jgi:glutathione S-transferase
VLDFGAGVGQPRNPAHKNLAAWFERVGKRPSAEASIHPAAKAGGMRA